MGMVWIQLFAFQQLVHWKADKAGVSQPVVGEEKFKFKPVKQWLKIDFGSHPGHAGYIYIYIYIKRESESETDRQTDE